MGDPHEDPHMEDGRDLSPTCIRVFVTWGIHIRVRTFFIFQAGAVFCEPFWDFKGDKKEKTILFSKKTTITTSATTAVLIIV